MDRWIYRYIDIKIIPAASPNSYLIPREAGPEPDRTSTRTRTRPRTRPRPRPRPRPRTRTWFRWFRWFRCLFLRRNQLFLKDRTDGTNCTHHVPKRPHPRVREPAVCVFC